MWRDDALLLDIVVAASDDAVRLDVVWTVVQESLPSLLAQIAPLIPPDA